MTDETQELSEDMQAALDKAQGKEADAEVKPDEEAVEPEEKPVETDETEEPEQEPGKHEAPSLVRKYSPVLAEAWDKLTHAQKDKALEEIAAKLEAAPKEADKPKQGAEAGDRSGVPNGGEGSQDGAAKHAALPTPLTSEEISSLQEFFGDEDPAGKAIQKLILRDQQMGEFLDGVLKDVDAALTKYDGHLSKIEQERLLESALEDHAEEIGEVTKPEFVGISEAAVKLVQDRRVSNYDDAVSLALLELRKGEKPKTRTEPEVGERNRRREQAKSLGTSGRQPGTATAKKVETFEDAWELARQQVGG